MEKREALRKLKILGKEDSKTDLERKVTGMLVNMIKDYDNPSNLWEDLSHGCSSGIVSELIYYTDTHKFAKRYIEDILELKAKLEEDLGEPITAKDDQLNWLAWFGFEETARNTGLELGLDL